MEFVISFRQPQMNRINFIHILGNNTRGDQTPDMMLAFYLNNVGGVLSKNWKLDYGLSVP